jgi:hypothetical protein
MRQAEAFSHLTSGFGANICLKQQRLALQHQPNLYLEPKWLKRYTFISCDSIILFDYSHAFEGLGQHLKLDV